MATDILTSDSEIFSFKDEDYSSAEEQLEPQPAPNADTSCPYEGCGLKFRRSTNLDRHIYQVHSPIKKHVCTIDGCGKSYIISTHLRRHIRTFHEKRHENHVRRIQCSFPDCGRYLNTQTSLKRHVREYHGDSTSYKCSECGLETRRKPQFIRHMEKHEHDKNPQRVTTKVYTCETCSENFSKWSQLQGHKKKAHPPTCTICNRTFSQKKNLRTHLLDHRTKTESSKLTCPHDGCTSQYLYRRNLNAHIRVAHEGLRFECPVEQCGKEFTSKRRLQKHVELHYKEDIIVERKPPATRKDAGIKKKSTVSLLAGIEMDKSAERMILEGKGKDMDVDYSSFVTTTDSEGDEIHVPRKINVSIPKPNVTE